jgi:hypothetical protein
MTTEKQEPILISSGVDRDRTTTFKGMIVAVKEFEEETKVYSINYEMTNPTTKLIEVTFTQHYDNLGRTLQQFFWKKFYFPKGGFFGDYSYLLGQVIQFTYDNYRSIKDPQFKAGECKWDTIKNAILVDQPYNILYVGKDGTLTNGTRWVDQKIYAQPVNRALATIKASDIMLLKDKVRPNVIRLWEKGNHYGRTKSDPWYIVEPEELNGNDFISLINKVVTTAKEQRKAHDPSEDFNVTIYGSRLVEHYVDIFDEGTEYELRLCRPQYIITRVVLH